MVAQGKTEVYIGLQAAGRKLLIGFPHFLEAGGEQSRQLREVTRDDLLATRLFDLVEGGPMPLATFIDYPAWKQLGSDVLLVVKAGEDAGKIVLAAQLFDVTAQALVFSKRFEAPPVAWRRAAHDLVDELVARFTGVQGIAHTQIVFANDATGYKEIYRIDADGANLARLTRDASIALFPRWSPHGKTILYTSYRHQNPDLFLMQADGRGHRPVSTRQGLNTTAAWAPNGEMIALTLSMGGDPDLYLMTPEGRLIRRLTREVGVDTSPSFSPDGQKLVYVSDYPGYPQLYIIDVDGTNRRRLTYAGWCDTPAWSPRGDWIAFAKQEGGNPFNIYLADPATGLERQLTVNAGRNETPAWSPDGRFLVFTSTRNGKAELFIMGADGSQQRPLATIPGTSGMPDWSP
ncbi:MAG: PD40 domain-containing protein [Elusimicrobia bacterium]|nr:PD40 domain-containing protein [Elusimicrobiota bacterium]